MTDRHKRIAVDLAPEYSEKILLEVARRHDAKLALDEFLGMTEDDREKVLKALREEKRK